MSKAKLTALCESSRADVAAICLPTRLLAEEYGVSDLEEIEYGALEVAREVAEQSQVPVIVALEVDDSLITRGIEQSAGIIEGDFSVSMSNVVAFYLIKDHAEELEWYDASESLLCLAQVEG
jgi:hypothetical protein